MQLELEKVCANVYAETNEILTAGAGPLDRTIYLAWMYGHFEDWPKDVDAVLPGIFKTVSDDDRIGPIEGSA